MIKKISFILLFIINISYCQKVLLPMDNTQNDHLKAYGLVFSLLENSNNVEWLLNFRGGSFLFDYE